MSKQPSAMRDPRNLLILLGFICQGYSFEYYYMAVVYALIWWGALTLRRDHKFLPEGSEEVVALLAIVGSFSLGTMLQDRFGYNRLVFIGNGLVLFQAMRLMRPLNLREKKYSIAIALIHLGVGTQVVVNYEFILVLGAALYLLPRSLFAMEAEQYRHIAGGRQAGLNAREFLYLGVIMVVFFLFFPRVPIAPGANPLSRMGGQQPDEIDMSEGGAQASDIVLFRIEGDDVEYVKGSALDNWDGVSWTQTYWINHSDRFPNGQDIEGTKVRTVKVMSHQLLRHSAPVDGYVERVEGSFGQQPYIADHGGLMLPVGFRGNMTYRYWTHLDAGHGKLDERHRNRYLALDAPVSPQLQQWLNQRTGNMTDPEQIASVLSRWFQENHAYEIGAPNLDRLAPVDDFVLNQASGHCERFASALAVLLRMRGIPSRVAMGWAATEHNDTGNFYTIRARHGHAWTEAWIEGKGWVIFDGTPYGDSFDLERRSLGLTVFEWIEYVWYAKIVEFGTTEQNAVVNVVGQAVQRTAALLITYGLVLLVFGLVLFFVWVLWRRGIWRRLFLRRAQATSYEAALKEARHFYGRMLRILAKGRLYRRPGQTPWEFLSHVEAERPQVAREVRELTQWFCDIRYGQRPVNHELRILIHETLGRLRGK